MSEKESNYTDADDGISRRQFLRFSQQLFVGASALSLCPLSLRASDIDALELQHIDSSSARLLAQVSRVLFPYEGLNEQVYLDVIGDIESDMVKNSDTKSLIDQATAIFNKKAGGDWLSLASGKQIEILRAMRGSKLFQYMHTRTVESLYGNPEVWKMIGYQGSSIEHGGYLHRGFDDIDWLEEE